MEEVLKKALGETKIPFYYLRGNNADDTCIVYKYSEKPLSFSDDDEDIISYKIILMLFCRGGLNAKKKNIKKAMKDNGFIISGVPEALIDDTTEIISQSLMFSYFEKK